MSLTRFREVFKTRLNLSNFSHLRLLHKRPFNVQSSQISFNIPNGQNKVYKWLFVCSGVVFTMVVVGGVTRLTRSGLSMTSWKFLGQKFPFNQKMWEEEFARYKTFPEYKKLTSEMDLNGFKKIYVMEYLHRMLGRLLGLVFAVPAVYFAARGFINRSIAKKLSLLFLLGGSQGLIGWWMVKSGLDEKPSTHLDLPRVSPYRLSVHLVSAFVIYLALVKTGLNSLDLHLLSQNRFKTFLNKLPPTFLRRSVLVTSLIVFMTAFSGAFVAGNEAGSIYNTFPWMGEEGRLVPTDYFNEFILEKWKNFFENQPAVQFNHRLLGISSFICCVLLPFTAKRGLPKTIKTFLVGTALMAAIQTGLGISTLIRHVPTDLAAMHQAGALTLLTFVFVLLHLISPSRHRLYLKYAKSIRKINKTI